VSLAAITSSLTSTARLAQPDAGIAHAQAELTVPAAGRNIDASTLRLRLDAVANGILYQRQQDERRKAQRSRVIVDLHIKSQPLAHPVLHHRKVAPADLELVVNGRQGVGVIPSQAWNGRAQIIAQRVQRVFGPSGIAAQARSDGGQGIEEEVRLDLRLQQ